MKKIFKISLATLLIVILLNNFSFGQAKKPTIMVVPSKNWCDTNHFVTKIENQGKKKK